MDVKYCNGVIQKIIRVSFKKNHEVLTNKDTVLSNRNHVFDKTLRNELALVDPKNILCPDRLDIIVRYLLFKDLVYDNLSNAHKSLYCRTILTRTGGEEKADSFSNIEKLGVEEHINQAKILLNSIKEKGFFPENYVPIAEDYGLYDGAHRIASALALDKNIWVRFCGKKGVRNMGFSWFSENGFSLEDKVRILRGYADIHSECGIYVLYGTCAEKWPYIEHQINKQLTIVGKVDLDFKHDYIAFENLIHEIYQDYSEGGTIADKIHLLKFSDMIIRIILVMTEHDGQDIYKVIRETKKEIRDYLDADYPKDAFVTLHASDTLKEFGELKQVVLSVNNLRYFHKRMVSNVRAEFITWIEAFKKFTKEHNIDINDTCIVGSSPLEVVGIRNSTDIDIVVSSEMRTVYGDGVNHLTDTLDIVTRNYVRNNSGVIITDDQLIHDDNCHFMFMGCKFANIDYVLLRKSSSEREKDIIDVKLMQVYNNYVKWFDDKKVLIDQIDNEIKRRKDIQTRKRK